MAAPNTNYDSVSSTTIENRSSQVADNYTKNSALLRRLKKRGNVKPFSGGTKITQPLVFAENTNAGWYGGYDLLNVGAQEVITLAEYTIKQLAAPVPMSGLERIQNSGKEALLDLLAIKLENAEGTLQNLLAAGIYADGTGSGGKELGGLGAAVPVDPTAGTYGNISRVNFTFWRPRMTDTNAVPSSSTILGLFNAEMAALQRGNEKPDLVPMDNSTWVELLEALQGQQEFRDPDLAEAGFSTLRYQGADCVLDGGIGGFCPTGTSFFINSKYAFLRPHSGTDAVSMGKRVPVNQDATVDGFLWAGNFALSNSQLHSRLTQS